MKKLSIYLSILMMATAAQVGIGAEKAAAPIDYTNLLLGTDIFPYPELAGHNSQDPDFGLYANEIVGPSMPAGMVSPSPLTSFRGITYHARGAGYCHSDKYIIGFSQLNTEYNSYMNPIIMPVVGRLYTASGDADDTVGYRVEKDSATVAELRQLCLNQQKNLDLKKNFLFVNVMVRLNAKRLYSL